MELNKRNTFKHYELNSNISNDYELNSDTLDRLYKEQLTVLRELILTKTQSEDIEICRQWLKVFNRISDQEKMARNCLCTLMQEQIKENSCLQEPFTNLQNCKRNLECVLRDLDDHMISHLSTHSFRTVSGETFKSHGFNNLDQNQDTINTILKEKQIIDLKTDAIKVTNELKFLRLQINEKQIENIKLKEIASKHRMEIEALEEMLNQMKNVILENIKELLFDMRKCGITKTNFKFFQYIFTQFSNDPDFRNIVMTYDLDLLHILHKHFKCEFDKKKSIIAKHICRKFLKSKTKLREKFQHRLIMQTESHKLQLKLSKLNTFSILRQIFINYYNESGKLEGLEILKTLEDKYQNIVSADL